MSELALPKARQLARLEKTERQRRLADAKVDVARRALLAEEELVPLMRERLDAWREWGEALGRPEPLPPPPGGVSGDNASIDGAKRVARHKARRLRWDVGEADFLAYREREKVDELTLAGVLRLAKPEPKRKPPPPDGRYRCIVVDPPWPIQKIEREERPNQRKALDYCSMSIEEIAALPIPDLAAEDGCHVYLWVTHKYLPVGLEILAGWSARYECVLTWAKPTGVAPFSWLYDTEHVLFARIGSLALEQLGLRLWFSTQDAKRTHSVKPDIFYERAKLASPEPRLAMFERGARQGFEVWGDEVESAA